MPDVSPDEIASLVLEQFDRLPQKRKPAVRDNGIHEWVPMSGIVAEVDGSLRCLSLATGMKCLPASKLPLAKGTALHDWHAEILAIRCLNHFLLEECKAVASGNPSCLIRPRSSQERRPREAPECQDWQGQPFAVKEGVRLHMYCSEAPCGDASMELTMAAQADASPWEEPPRPLTTTSGSPAQPPPNDAVPVLSGRGYFSQLGTVRRKPARGDAPPTLSKSCSDKLALKQCTSLLSSAASLLIHPGNAYLASVVLPESQFSAAGCARSFSPAGRMRGVAVVVAAAAGGWPGGYAFRPFEVRTTTAAAAVEFAYSRREVAKQGGGGGGGTSASNLAAAWSAAGLEEGLVGGVLQGRKQFDARGASGTSRRRMWALALEVARMDGAEGDEVRKALETDVYGNFKDGELLEARRSVKRDVRRDALEGWVRNTGDENFGV